MNTCTLCEGPLALTEQHFTCPVTMFDNTYTILAHAICLSRRALGEQARWTPGVCV